MTLALPCPSSAGFMAPRTRASPSPRPAASRWLPKDSTKAARNWPAPRHLRRQLQRSHLLQIDSVNVLVRAHYMPLFSRLGAYDREPSRRRRLSAAKKRAPFEYWGHEASLIPLDLHPLFRWRMARAAAGRGHLWRARPLRPGEARLHRRGAARDRRRAARMAAGELSNGGTGQGSWWGWSDGKRALEWLFWAGEVTTATRRGFERVYDLPERVLPAAILNAPTPSAETRRSANSCGCSIASARHRHASAACATISASTSPDTKPRVRGAGRGRRPAARQGRGLERAGLSRSCHAKFPRRVEARALLSPFDPHRLGAHAHRAPVRFPLPHRDLHARREARIRLLLPALPARREQSSPGSTSRPTAPTAGSSSTRSIPKRRCRRRRSLRRSAKNCA